MDAFDADETGVSPLASPLLPATGALLSPSKTKGTVMIPELSLTRAPPVPPGNASGSSTPKRRISLYQKRSHSKMGGGVKRKKEPLLVQSPEVRSCACENSTWSTAHNSPVFACNLLLDAGHQSSQALRCLQRMAEEDCRVQPPLQSPHLHGHPMQRRLRVPLSRVESPCTCVIIS